MKPRTGHAYRDAGTWPRHQHKRRQRRRARIKRQPVRHRPERKEVQPWWQTAATSQPWWQPATRTERKPQ